MDRPPQSDRSKKIELVQQILDQRLQELIEFSAQKINEGNNGVILAFSPQDLHPDIREHLEASGIVFEDEQVIKILKVYSEGQGRREYELQQKAHEILASAPPGTCAQVPKTLFFRNMKVTPSFTEKVQKWGVKPSLEGRVEIFAMDLIAGKDLASILYAEVLKRMPQKDFWLRGRNPDEMDMKDLVEEVSNLLGFKFPPLTRDEGELIEKERLLMQQNERALYAYLRQKGFSLHPSVSKQIEYAVNVLDRAGIYHRDMHHRNVLLSTGRNSNDPPQVSIIDFGAAITVPPGTNEDDIFAEELPGGRKNYPFDRAIVGKIRKELEGGSAYVISERGQKWITTWKEMQRDKNILQKYAQTVQNLKTGNPFQMRTWQMAAKTLDKFMAGVYQMALEGIPLQVLQEGCKSAKTSFKPNEGIILDFEVDTLMKNPPMAAE